MIKLLIKSIKNILLKGINMEEFDLDIKVKNAYHHVEVIERKIDSSASLEDLNKYNERLEKYYESLIALTAQPNDKDDVELCHIIYSNISNNEWVTLISDCKNKIKKVTKIINTFGIEDNK